ncbi:hypothetical protein K440DRAFT_638981 [Wilcoxina mikolae CBS 423.85]|nr:hypothetical protein K440DRAFT_638981 [Wilcoxina mikolae CBS 423.85]
MRDFYDGVNTTEIFRPVSPSVYRRSLFPTSPRKPHYQSQNFDRFPLLMDQIPLTGLDLDRHFPPLPKSRGQMHYKASLVPRQEYSSTDLVIIHDLGIPAGFGGPEWNTTSRNRIKVVAMALDNEKYNLGFGVTSRQIKTGEWFLVSPEQVPSVEALQGFLHDHGFSGNAALIFPGAGVACKTFSDFLHLAEGHGVVMAVMNAPNPASQEDEVGIWMACGPPEVRKSYVKWAGDSPTEEFFPREDIWGPLGN